MCGFFVTNDPNVDYGLYSKIVERIGFRGPDRHSPLVQFSGWKLFHARLSIIAPREEFNQPFMADDGAILIFNGEILNFVQLAQKYGLEKNESDTEVLACLLQKPEFMLDELEGFFSFVRINSEGELTHCSRDRFGVKPLFYYVNGDVLTIASEASIISDIYDLSYSEASMDEYRVFRYPVFEGTYFEQINQVEPGSCLVSGQYFNALDYFNKYEIADDDILDNVRTAIHSGITSRLVSDVPVGLLYSGGIDSNLIRYNSQLSLTKITGGTEFDYDMEFATEQSSRYVDEKFETIKVSSEQFKKRFSEMIALRKEPLSVPNEVILSYLAESWARQGGKVLLSGEAADEFFAGYDRVFSWAANADRFDVDQFLELYCYVPWKDISDTIKIKVCDFFAGITDLGPFEMVRYFFIKKHLPILFRRLDFALMYAGVEGREPLAAFDVFKVAVNIKPEHFFRDGLGKLPLRKLAAEALGTEFAFSPKVGFPVDLARIFENSNVEGRLGNYEIWYRENLRGLK